ncbi:para-nitrophenol 4-monooxygenase [Pyrenophora seminiperda CCB06]|uniref:Para-nitrophenol 4-monooxygenase n=1 Tax=Pyrenophora seminiperda CCB06 TaxID=1302712 RepID=A0A3M7LVH6_9PLEO|nr:para-nitrophenol 4-monooxygenase [Pyrenophora seminiperda CCB06]
MTNTTQPLPVVIAGGGCVGLFLALLLAQSNIPNHIIVIEPQQPDPTSTRAMAHQPPTYPILAKVNGLLPELVKAGSLSSGLCFRTSVQNGSRVIASKTFDNNSGPGMKGKGQLLLPQGKFQQVLMKRLAAFGDDKVELRLESIVSASRPSAKSVQVHISPASPSSPQFGEESAEAAYLIDASGAHSLIRKHLGISLEGETLDAQLVATDLYFDFHAHGFYDANFIIDPHSYGLIGRISPKRDDERVLWRVSYCVPIGLSEEDIKKNMDEKLRDMLPNGGRNEQGEIAYEVVRVAPYKAHQRLASTLYDHSSRTCLIGDAAHLTNPYAGLGLASGMADAASLSDVLVRILKGQASSDEKLLNAWSEARRKVFTEVIDKPSRMAYKRVKADVSTDDKLQGMMKKDPLVAALKNGMPVQPPSLEMKGEELEGW